MGLTQIVRLGTPELMIAEVRIGGSIHIGG
jgi:hypothetical protein